MKHVVLVFNDPYGFIWPMIVTRRKLFTIFNVLIQDHSVHCSSTVAGGLCIITIMISPISDQASVDHQFYVIDYYSDISTKPRIKLHTKESLNPITDIIPNLRVTSHPLKSYFHRLILYSQCWWCWWWWWCRCCYCYCCCRGRAHCCWQWQTCP